MTGRPEAATFSLTMGPDDACTIDFLAEDEVTVVASVELSPAVADLLAKHLTDRRETWAQIRQDALKARH